MKGGLTVLTRYMAKEFSTARHPRQLRRPRLHPHPDSPTTPSQRYPEVIPAIAAKTALGRVGEPDDVGMVIATLVSRREPLDHRADHRGLRRLQPLASLAGPSGCSSPSAGQQRLASSPFDRDLRANSPSAAHRPARPGPRSPCRAWGGRRGVDLPHSGTRLRTAIPFLAMFLAVNPSTYRTHRRRDRHLSVPREPGQPRWLRAPPRSPHG